MKLMLKAVPAAAVAVLALVVACAMMFGCSPTKPAASPERDVARGAVLVIVEAVDVADGVCADIAARAKGSTDAEVLKKAIALAKQCADGKDAALVAAKGARSIIASYTAARAGELACAGVHALDALNLVRDAIDRAGGHLPEPIEDGINRAAYLAHFAAGSCSTGGAS